MSSSDFNGSFRGVAEPTLKCGGQGVVECNPALGQLHFRHIAATCIVALGVTQRTRMKRAIGGEFYCPPTVEELVRLHTVDCNTMLSLTLEQTRFGHIAAAPFLGSFVVSNIGADAFQAHRGSPFLCFFLGRALSGLVGRAHVATRRTCGV